MNLLMLSIYLIDTNHGHFNITGNDFIDIAVGAFVVGIIGILLMRVEFIRELWDFLKVRKKWWLLPIVVVLLLIGILIVIGGAAPAAAPFVYTLF